MELKGQWWERLGHVLFLPVGLDPNDYLVKFTGWVQIDVERARLVLENRPKDEPYDPS